MFRRLISEHHYLRDLAARLTELYSSDDVGDLELIQSIRVQLGARIAQHNAAEKLTVYSPLSADPRASIRGLERPLTNKIDDLIEAYAIHKERWPIDQIRLHWKQFCAESKVLLARLVNQMDWEEADLFPAIQRIQCTAPQSREPSGGP